MSKVMVFVPVNEVDPHNPHEWQVRDGVVTMGRPSIGFNSRASMTHRNLHTNPEIKFKELRNE